MREVAADEAESPGHHDAAPTVELAVGGVHGVRGPDGALRFDARVRDQPPRRGRRLDQHGAGHLGLALPALDEGDRHFGDPAAVAVRDEQHLHQERIPVGKELIERQRRQRRSLPAAVARRAVVRADAGDGADVGIREPAEDVPLERPVQDRAAGNVARPDHHVRVLGGREERGQLRRVVRQVGVHLADQVDRFGQRLLHAVDIRAAESPVGGPVQHRHPSGVFEPEFVGQRAGAVRRVVVHDKHAHARRAPSGPRRAPEGSRARCRSG